MKLIQPVVTFTALMLASGAVLAQQGLTSELDASIRFGLGLETEPETDIGLNNYGSRLRWNGSADMDDSNKIISYLEFGFDQDAGVSETRQAWVGVEGNFGTVKAGKQYRAYYDAVSSQTDIAWWGSCEFETSCTRQSNVVKFTGVKKGDLQLMASTTLLTSAALEDAGSTTTSDILDELGNLDEPAEVEDAGNFDDEFDTDSDLFDEIDFGAKFDMGELSVGAAATISSAQDTGLALGVGATMQLKENTTASATAQFASDDYLGGDDNGILFSGALKQDQYYGVFAVGNADNTPYYITLGYEMPLIQDRALAYFEVEAIDQDQEDIDLDLNLRAVLVFNFDVASIGS